MPYTPYLIADFRQGQENNIEPWLLPAKAYETLTNAYVMDGVLRKRRGYTEYDKFVEYASAAPGSGSTITAATKANPCQITLSAAASWITGQKIQITGVGGMTELNYKTFTLTKLDNTHFTLGVDSSAYGVYTSGGTACGVTEPGSETITGISKANPGVVTTSKPHWLSTGDTVRMVDIGGMTELEGDEVTVTVVTATTFSIGTNTTSYTTFTSGGEVHRINDDPIMGIMQYQTSSDIEELIVCSDDRACKYDTDVDHLVPIQDIQEIIGRGDGATATYSGTLVNKPIECGSLVITDGTKTATDDGSGGFTGDVSAGSINYTSGAYSVTFDANITDGNAITASYDCKEDIFTGGADDFFSCENYGEKLWLTNGVDRIKTWNGTTFDNHIFDLTNEDAETNEINTCLHIKAFRGRLILFYTTESSTAYPQRLRWCTNGNPDKWWTGAGGGSHADLDVNGFIRNAGYIGDTIAIIAGKSAFTLRYTANPAYPYTVSRISNYRYCDSPYAMVEMDNSIITIGRQGIIATDGNTITEIDQLIPDYILDNVDGSKFDLVYGIHVEEYKQVWFAYPEEDESTSSAILVYNYEDGAWSTYDIAMNCFGYHKEDSDLGFDDYPDESFESFSDYAWDEFVFASTPIVLGGSADGILYKMNFGNSDNGTGFDVMIKGKQWNPYAEQGNSARLGYVDFLVSESGAEASVAFFEGQEGSAYQTKTLTFDTSTNQGKVWKRLYSGAISTFHKLEITDSASTDIINIHAIRLWFEPVSRGIGNYRG